MARFRHLHGESSGPLRDGASLSGAAALEAWLESKLDGSQDPELVARARAGHSPSARSLCNAGDLVVRLAEEAAGPPPSASLGARILAAAQQASPRGQGGAVSPAPLRPPNEALGVLHASLPGEAARTALAAELGLRGPFGPTPERERPTDDALRLVVDQLAPYLSFEMVYVSAVDGAHTIHRVQRGFPPGLEVVPRELSFCTHTLSAGEAFVVEDASREAFFRASELVSSLGARAYVGVPLSLPREGDVVHLGSLCGLSQHPRPVVPEDVGLMKVFAHVALALVSKDRERLDAVFAEPPGYPGSRATTPKYRAEVFADLAQAVRLRAGSASVMPPDAAAVLHVPADVDPQALASDASTIVGRMGDGSLRVLVAGADRVEVVAERLGATARHSLLR
jgi:GAF domain-containing protein